MADHMSRFDELSINIWHYYEVDAIASCPAWGESCLNILEQNTLTSAVSGMDTVCFVIVRQAWTLYYMFTHFLLLLLLRSIARSLRFTILGEIFVYVTVCNPTIEVVTFHLCG